MSFLNLISEKTAGTALANSRALSKYTNTTYAQAGTSLPKITANTIATAKNSISQGGGTDEKFNTPFNAMRDYAINSDPSNAVAYRAAADNAYEASLDNASASLGGFNNSLYDIQSKTREAIASGIDGFGTSMNSINPSIAQGATNAGISALAETGRAIDSAVTTGFNSATSYISNQVSTINNTIADNATKAADIAAAATSGVGLPTFDETDTTGVGVSTNLSAFESVDEDEDGGFATVKDNNTDIVYQEVRIYVEGVQVPFESCSVTQAIGQLPTASFQVPPQAGLMDIARYYQPKVHIFYRDANIGGDRLLFWGHIIAVNYTRSQAAGQASISFECIHKNALLQQVTFEWSGTGAGPILNGGQLVDSATNPGAAQLNNFNSEVSLIRALQGVVGLQTEDKDLISPKNKDVLRADPTLLDKKFAVLEERIQGMPSAIMNLWNQVKLEVYSNESLNVIFSKMFIPLLEDGVKFFDRMSGHPFLEKQIHNSRVEHCNDHSRPELSKRKTMLPPAYRMDIQSAVQTKMAISSLKSTLGYSGELSSFYDLFTNFYYGIEYELLTLASPSEVPVDPSVTINPDDPVSWRNQKRMAIETIVKPQLPFYYAPLCNVLLPNMYYSIQVQQSEGDIPTRVTAINTAPGQATNDPNVIGLNYRAPHSIREGIALGRKKLKTPSDDTGVGVGTGEAFKTFVSLRETTGSSYNLPGKYELGRGIKHKKIAMPLWLSHFSKEEDGKRASKADEQLPIEGSLEHKNMINLHDAWVDRYGYTETFDPLTGESRGRVRDVSLDGLNPFSSRSEVMAYERLLFSSADYEFTKEVVRSKHGQVEGIFNPYIIPGYPMDIIDASPNHPSFHAMCSNVTHSISARGISTTIGFMAAITYAELSNYEIQHVHPWLRNALCMINISRESTSTPGSEAAQNDIKTAPDPLVEADLQGVGLPNDSLKPTPTDPAKEHEQSTAYGLTPNEEYDSNKGDIKEVTQGLINNHRARAVADQFYASVLGIGAAEPGLMYNFNEGGYRPLERSRGRWFEGNDKSVHSSNGGELNDNLTAVGNLRLVCRPIEGRRAIEHRFGIKFIDLTPQNYNATKITYENKVLTNSKLLEPGASMFLDYTDISELIKDIE